MPKRAVRRRGRYEAARNPGNRAAGARRVVAELGPGHGPQCPLPQIGLALAADMADIDVADQRVPVHAIAVEAEQTLRRVAPEQMRRAAIEKSLVKAAGKPVEFRAILVAKRKGERAGAGEQALAIVASAEDGSGPVDAIDRRWPCGLRCTSRCRGNSEQDTRNGS
ncbi:MAG: hypothetical protein WA177_20550 [Xanthobacteraceae bacterium]